LSLLAAGGTAVSLLPGATALADVAVAPKVTAAEPRVAVPSDTTDREYRWEDFH
jgi:hypothetical protein